MDLTALPKDLQDLAIAADMRLTDFAVLPLTSGGEVVGAVTLCAHRAHKPPRNRHGRSSRSRSRAAQGQGQGQGPSALDASGEAPGARPHGDSGPSAGPTSDTEPEPLHDPGGRGPAPGQGQGQEAAAAAAAASRKHLAPPLLGVVAAAAAAGDGASFASVGTAAAAAVTAPVSLTDRIRRAFSRDLTAAAAGSDAAPTTGSQPRSIGSGVSRKGSLHSFINPAAATRPPATTTATAAATAPAPEPAVLPPALPATCWVHSPASVYQLNQLAHFLGYGFFSDTEQSAFVAQSCSLISGVASATDVQVRLRWALGALGATPFPFRTFQASVYARAASLSLRAVAHTALPFPASAVVP